MIFTNRLFGDSVSMLFGIRFLAMAVGILLDRCGSQHLGAETNKLHGLADDARCNSADRVRSNDVLRRKFLPLLFSGGAL
jgi:hypothetical protein